MHHFEERQHRTYVDAEALKESEVGMLAPAHTVHHGGGQAEGAAGHGLLWVAPQDEAEVDVQHAAVGAEHDVVQVPVADACVLGCGGNRRW